MKRRITVFCQQHRVAVGHAGVILALGVVYYVWVSVTSLRIPCLFHEVTGLFCPGCGITRFFLALFRLDVAVAVQQNAAVAVLLPLWLLVGAVKIFRDPPAWQKDSRLKGRTIKDSSKFFLIARCIAPQAAIKSSK